MTVRAGIELFNQRRFFECHEAIEAVWVQTHGPRRLFLQGLIHLAVGFHHERNGNAAGARLQLRKGLRKLAGYLPECEGMDTGRLYRDALRALDKIEAGESGIEYPEVQFL